MPGAIGLRMEGSDPGCSGEFGELYGAGLGDARGALGAIGGEGADAMALCVGLLHATQRQGASSSAGAADSDESKTFDDARDEFAVEGAGDEDRNALVAEAVRADQQGAVPKGEDRRAGNCDADRGGRGVYVAITQGHTEQTNQRNGERRDDGQEQTLLWSENSHADEFTCRRGRECGALFARAATFWLVVTTVPNKGERSRKESGRASARYPTLPRKERASRMGHPVVVGHSVLWLALHFDGNCSSMVRMRYVEFGEIRTSVLGFGCGSVLGRVGRRDSLHAMNTAWNAGVTLFDTARSYGYGEAEGLLGEFLRGKRGQATVVTKFGILPARPVAWKRLAKPIVRAGLSLLPQARRLVRRGIAGEMSEGHFDVATLRASLEESLRQLRTDYVDVLLLHLPPVSAFQQQDLMAELEMVVREGKVRRVGVSTDDVATFRGIPDFLTATQFPYPVLSLDRVNWDVRDKGLFVMANHPFGGAALARQAAQKIAQMATDVRVDPVLREKLRGDSRERLAEIVFGEVLADTGAHAVVTSMLQPENLRANLAAMGSERFTAKEMVVVRERVVGSGQ